MLGTQVCLPEPVFSPSLLRLSGEAWKRAAQLEEPSRAMFLSALIKLKAVFLSGLHEQLPKASAVNPGIFNFIKCLEEMRLCGEQAKS